MSNATVEPPTCPHCGSTDVSEYLYGLVELSDIMEFEKQGKKVIPAGCVIEEDSPDFKCNGCDKDFIVQAD